MTYIQTVAMFRQADTCNLLWHRSKCIFSSYLENVTHRILPHISKLMNYLFVEQCLGYLWWIYIVTFHSVQMCVACCCRAAADCRDQPSWKCSGSDHAAAGEPAAASGEEGWGGPGLHSLRHQTGEEQHYTPRSDWFRFVFSQFSVQCLCHRAKFVVCLPYKCAKSYLMMVPFLKQEKHCWHRHWHVVLMFHLRSATAPLWLKPDTWEKTSSRSLPNFCKTPTTLWRRHSKVGGGTTVDGRSRVSPYVGAEPGINSQTGPGLPKIQSRS